MLPTLWIVTSWVPERLPARRLGDDLGGQLDERRDRDVPFLDGRRVRVRRGAHRDAERVRVRGGVGRARRPERDPRLALLVREQPERWLVHAGPRRRRADDRDVEAVDDGPPVADPNEERGLGSRVDLQLGRLDGREDAHGRRVYNGPSDPLTLPGSARREAWRGGPEFVIKCGVCGSENEAEALFCGTCGSELPRPDTAAIAKQAEETTAVDTASTDDSVVPGKGDARRDLTGARRRRRRQARCHRHLEGGPTRAGLPDTESHMPGRPSRAPCAARSTTPLGRTAASARTSSSRRRRPAAPAPDAPGS